MMVIFVPSLAFAVTVRFSDPLVHENRTKGEGFTMSFSLNNHEKSHAVYPFNEESGLEGAFGKDHCRRVNSDQDAAQRVFVETAEGSSGGPGPPKYLVGTKVKKVRMTPKNG
jgi:hypothetical protein